MPERIKNMKDERAKEQARAQLDSIIEMVKNLGKAIHLDEIDEIEICQTAIQDDPLSVEVRSGWVNCGETMTSSEYRILLCTGGPAVQIIGYLNEYSEPDTAILQYQDWGTMWENYYGATLPEEEMLLDYARQFYFSD